jgi:hypothetical protein
MKTVAGGGRQEKWARPRNRLHRELARAPVWDLGEWGSDAEHVEAEDETRGVARWGEAVADRRALGEDLVDGIRTRQGKPTPESGDRAALLEALARHPLFVSPWVADPEVRRKVSLFRHTSNGRIVLDVVVPILSRFAIRLAWDEVAVPLEDADPHRVATDLHARAMAHLGSFLAEIEPDSVTRLAAIPHRERERVLSQILDPARLLGRGWRRRLEVMLNCTAGALRTWRWRAKKTVTRPRTSIRGKSRS